MTGLHGLAQSFSWWSFVCKRLGHRPSGTLNRMLRLAIALCCLVALPAAADDDAIALGTLRIHAWLARPQMPAIQLTRGPLQQVIEDIRPESLRPAATSWETAITRHRRQRRASREAMTELERHFRHQVLLQPERATALRSELDRSRSLLSGRFASESTARTTRLRLAETPLLQGLSQATKTARGQLLESEIHFARYEDAWHASVTRYEVARVQWLQGGRVGPEPARPMPMLAGVVVALKTIIGAAPGRLTRERAIQLLAECYSRLSLDAEAVTLLEGARRTRVSWSMAPELGNRLGDLFLANQRFAAASRAYGGVTSRSRTWFVRAQLGLAWARYRQGDDDGAMRAVEAVRSGLSGLVDQSALALVVEAGRLKANLLADAGSSTSPDLSPRLTAAVKALRKRQAETLPLDVGPDGRLEMAAQQTVPMRRCYRRWLRQRRVRVDVSRTVRAVVAMRPSKAASVVSLSVSDRRLKSCLSRSLDAVVSLPDDRSAIVALELIPNAPAH